MSLPDHLILVDIMRIDASVEAEWNTWYRDVHLPEITACPGFVRSARYVSDTGSGDRRYATVYEVEGPDVLESPEFSERRGWGQFADHVEAEVRVYSKLDEVSER